MSTDRYEGDVHIEAAIPHFARVWLLSFEEAELKIRKIVRGITSAAPENTKKEVWSFLHGYNARDVRPKNVS